MTAHSRGFRRRLWSTLVQNAFAGAVVGAVIALGDPLKSPVSFADRLRGGAIGGLVGGLVAALATPLYRNRWTAGLATAIASSVAIWVALRLWQDERGLPIAGFFGAIAGLVHAGLKWSRPRIELEEQSAAVIEPAPINQLPPDAP